MQIIFINITDTQRMLKSLSTHNYFHTPIIYYLYQQMISISFYFVLWLIVTPWWCLGNQWVSTLGRHCWNKSWLPRYYFKINVFTQSAQIVRIFQIHQRMSYLSKWIGLLFLYPRLMSMFRYILNFANFCQFIINSSCYIKCDYFTKTPSDIHVRILFDNFL